MKHLYTQPARGTWEKFLYQEQAHAPEELHSTPEEGKNTPEKNYEAAKKFIEENPRKAITYIPGLAELKAETNDLVARGVLKGKAPLLENSGTRKLYANAEVLPSREERYANANTFRSREEQYAKFEEKSQERLAAKEALQKDMEKTLEVTMNDLQEAASGSRLSLEDFDEGIKQIQEKYEQGDVAGAVGIKRKLMDNYRATPSRNIAQAGNANAEEDKG